MNEITDPEQVLAARANEVTTPAEQVLVPKKREAFTPDPNINWAIAEKLYVEGEDCSVDGVVRNVQPTLREIASRSGATYDNLRIKVKRGGWESKRAAFEKTLPTPPAKPSKVVKQLARVPSVRSALKKKPTERVTERMTEQDEGNYEPRPFPAALDMPEVTSPVMSDTVAPLTASSKAEQVLLKYLELVEQKVNDPNFKLAGLSIGDLDKAVRALAFVRGEADSIRATHTTVTLEVMQERHKTLRARTASTLEDEVAGVIGRAEPIDTHGVDVTNGKSDDD